MTPALRDTTTGADEHESCANPGFFDEAILNEWLLSDPVPGTYSEFALQRSESEQMPLSSMSRQ